MQKNKGKNLFSKYTILTLAVIGVVTCLSPYLIPEPYYSTITLILYGKPYSSEALTALKTMPFHDNLHRVLGAVFAISGILQFNDSLRKKNSMLHRRIGYLFIFCSTLTAISGIVLGVVIPFAGQIESILVIMAGIYLLYATYKALFLAYQKDFSNHRNWMIRAFSFALGVISMRLFFFIINQTMTVDNHLLFNITIVAGFLFNVVLAELWILSRKPFAAKQPKVTNKQKLAS